MAKNTRAPDKMVPFIAPKVEIITAADSRLAAVAPKRETLATLAMATTPDISGIGRASR